MAFGRRFGPPIMHPNPVAEGEALSARDRLKAALAGGAVAARPGMSILHR